MTTNPPADELVTRVLSALRDTEAPRNLEARISARLAQAADAHTNPASRRTASSIFAATVDRTSPFAVILSFAKDPRILLAKAPVYALAAAVLLAASFLAFHNHPSSTTTAHNNPISAPINPSVASDLRAEGPPNHSLGRSPRYVPTATGGPKARPIMPANPALTPAPTDPEALALAETRAPSRPAPPMPLTPQEQLLVAATRQGQPIELAELDLLRAPALRSAAEARQNSTLRQFAQSLLGPLAMAESLNPDPPPNP